MISKLVLLFVVVGLGESGAPTRPGACPDYKAMTSIDATKVTGDWFEHFQGNVGFEEEHVATCDKTKVSSISNGVFQLANTFTDGTGKKQSKTSTLTKLPGDQAKFSVAADGIPKGTTVEVGVLGTDYTNWLTSVFCFSDGSKHGFTLHMYSRGNTIPAADVEKAKDALKALNVAAELKSVDHHNC